MFFISHFISHRNQDGSQFPLTNHMGFEVERDYTMHIHVYTHTHSYDGLLYEPQSLALPSISKSWSSGWVSGCSAEDYICPPLQLCVLTNKHSFSYAEEQTEWEPLSMNITGHQDGTPQQRWANICKMLDSKHFWLGRPCCLDYSSLPLQRESNYRQYESKCVAVLQLNFTYGHEMEAVTVTCYKTFFHLFKIR